MPRMMREMLANLAQAAQSDERASESAWLARREPKKRSIWSSSPATKAWPAPSIPISSKRRSGFSASIPAPNVSHRRWSAARGAIFSSAAHANIRRRIHSTCWRKPAYRRRRARSRAKSFAATATARPTRSIIINNEFKSVMTQKLSVLQVLPVDLARRGRRSADRLHLRTVAARNAGAPDAALRGSGDVPRHARNRRRRNMRRA